MNEQETEAYFARVIDKHVALGSWEQVILDGEQCLRRGPRYKDGQAYAAALNQLENDGRDAVEAVFQEAGGWVSEAEMPRLVVAHLPAATVEALRVLGVDPEAEVREMIDNLFTGEGWISTCEAEVA